MYVSFIGNLTRDAEEIAWTTREGETAKELVFVVAESTFFRGQKGTSFMSCVSESLKLAKFLTKGKRVAVCGNAVIERWEGKDGKPSSGVSVFVYNVKLL